MKKFLAGIAAAALLSSGAVAAESALVSSSASVVAPSDYPKDSAEVKQVVQKINKLIANDNLTPAKAVKLIEKLRNAKDVGVISKSKFKNLKAKIKGGL